MKAIVQDRYGSPDSLRLTEVDRPTPAAGQILARVHAAAANASDWHVMRGRPYLARLALPAVFGRTGPHNKIRGRDFAGTVAEVGPGVTGFDPGDEIYGDLGLADGTFAEFVCAPAAVVARKPARLTFEEAAAMPLAGGTALAGLRDAAQVRPGQRVLVNGASGGVGTFAVQIAKALGAEVTAVCSARNADLVRGLGATQVIDYARTDFTRGPERYEVLFDLVGNHSLADLRRATTPDGTIVLSGGGAPDGPRVVGPMGLLIQAQPLASLVSQRVIRLDTPLSSENLTALAELADAGQITPVIDRRFPLAEAAAAIRYLEVEHARAKVVITV